MTLQTLAFEIGTEEIPAFDLAAALQQLKKKVPALLRDAHIPYEAVEIYDSPRRIIVIASGIPEYTEALSEVFKGPSAQIAFDQDGNPTKAALGFARGKGVDASNLEVQDGYVYARRDTPAKEIITLLPEVLDAIVHGISWPKSQRWGSNTETFARPVRWLLALFGSQVVPFTYAGLTAGNTTYGHRFLAPGPFQVQMATELIPTLRNAYVVPSQDEREAVIRAGVAEVEQATGYTASLPAKTLLEVTNLAEYPNVVEAVFDEEFLQVPEEIIVDAMLMHQRYFPLYNAQGKLTNHFLVVSNGNPDCAETIADGNERVVRARLYDAKFFYDEDLKQPLASYVDQLCDVVFQEKLGTVLDKTHRIEALVAHLAKDAQLSAQDSADALRAAYLCKADLVTQAVVEFTSVQGVMGSYYAKAAGETNQVAQAIEQHYQPRFAGDATPTTVVGKLVACADKLDTIAGLFAINQGPSGSSDPFALRRSAIGIVAMLREGLPVSLTSAIGVALGSYTNLEFDFDEVVTTIQDFFVTRTTVMLKDEGIEPDVIAAVIACGVVEPAEIVKRCQALSALRAEIPEAMQDLATAFARANNLREAQMGTAVNTALFEPQEQALYDAVNQAAGEVTTHLANDNYRAALQALAALRNPIDAFFADIMVMDEDQAKRENRLALLNCFVAVFAQVADFSALVKTK